MNEQSEQDLSSVCTEFIRNPPTTKDRIEEYAKYGPAIIKPLLDALIEHRWQGSWTALITKEESDFSSDRVSIGVMNTLRPIVRAAGDIFNKINSDAESLKEYMTSGDKKKRLLEDNISNIIYEGSDAQVYGLSLVLYEASNRLDKECDKPIKLSLLQKLLKLEEFIESKNPEPDKFGIVQVLHLLSFNSVVQGRNKQYARKINDILERLKSIGLNSTIEDFEYSTQIRAYAVFVNI